MEEILSKKNPVETEEAGAIKKSRPLSLKERAYNRLERQIFSGYRRPGERLIETDLARELNVSRTIVREIIKQLAIEGLVDIVPYKGASVSRFSIQEIQEMYAIQSALEGLAVHQAIKKFSPREIEELEEIHDASKTKMPRDAMTWQGLNTRFHRIFLDHCGNTRLLKLVEGNNLKFARYWFLILSIPGRIEKSIDEHERILLAAKDKRAISGRYAME
ncbi:MAG: GntR family transcriptional regulator, partial [Candidatus Bathyarchaeia archaeon]